MVEASCLRESDWCGMRSRNTNIQHPTSAAKRGRRTAATIRRADVGCWRVGSSGSFSGSRGGGFRRRVRVSDNSSRCQPKSFAPRPFCPVPTAPARDGNPPRSDTGCPGFISRKLSISCSASPQRPKSMKSVRARRSRKSLSYLAMGCSSSHSRSFCSASFR